MQRPTAAAAALRTLILPTLLLVAWVLMGLLQPGLHATPAADETPALAWGRRLYQVLLWLLAAVVLHRWICVTLLDRFLANTLGRPMPKIFKDVLVIVLLLGALMGVLINVFGQSVGTFWAASGVVGIVLGIALRPIILDFFAGLGANLDRAYNLGDWIVVTASGGEPIRGWIEEINWRTLRIRTRDGVVVIVPNSRLATGPVINHSLLQPESRFSLRVLLDAEVPVDRALRVLSSAVFAAAAAPDGPVREPAPEVVISNASAEGIEYHVRYWLDPSHRSPDRVTHVVWVCLLDHLGKAGLTFAHPRENVFLARLPRIAHGYARPEDRVEFLRRVALLQGFPEPSLRWLAGETRLRSVRRGQVLVRAGDQGDSMFVVAEGTLRVLSGSPDERPSIELATLQPGDFLGERSLLTGEPRSASVVAVTDSVLLEVDREALRHLLQRQPELLAVLENAVAQRSLANQERMGVAELAAQGGAASSRTGGFLARMRELLRRPE